MMRKTLEFPANANAKPPRAVAKPPLTAAVVASLFPLRYGSKMDMMRRETLVANANAAAAVANPPRAPRGAGVTFRENMMRREKQEDITYANAAAAVVAPPEAASAKPTRSNGQSALKRLQSELMSLMMCGDLGISAFPEEDNIFIWKGIITGSKDTVYEGMVYKLAIAFPNEYPLKPPKVKFVTPCFHPNVDFYGNICLDILQDNWSAACDVRTILLSIQSILGEPNNDSPLNNIAATFWANKEVFKKMVEELYETVY